MHRFMPLLLLSVAAIAQQPAPAPAQPGQVPGGGRGGRGGTDQQNRPAQRPATKPEDMAAVEGQIVNGATGEPLGKARISLRREAQRDSVGYPGSYSATTDPGGRFTIPNVEPGTYRLSVARTGYVDADFGSRDYLTSGTPFTLSVRQRKSDINVRMTPNAVVTGKVVDEDGEPMQGLQVEAMRYRYSNGNKQLAGYAQATSNDIGEYRLSGLPPGRYFIVVTPRNRGNFGPPGRMMPASQPPATQDYVQTFFPSAHEPATAVPMDLGPGAQMRGIDFRMAKRPIVTIRGQLAGVTAGARQRPMLSLQSRLGGSSGARPAMVDANGNFEIRGVTPGSYNLIAAMLVDRTMLSTRIPLEVGSNNIENLSITIPAPVNLTGRVRIDGQPDATAATALANVQVMLRPREAGQRFGGANAPAKLQPDGTFAMTNLSAERYRFSFANIPDGYYVKSARVADQEVLLTGLDLSRGVALPVEITLRPNAGSAEGVVQNDQSQPAAAVTVVLVPQEPERRESALHYKTATTDDAGHFLLKNLDPGQYKVYAWTEIENGVYMDADFMRQYENTGESITVKEGATEKVQPRLIR